VLASQGVKIRCKPWRCRNGDRFCKEQFDIRLAERRVVCPAQVSAPINDSLVARFPAAVCASCNFHDQCTRAKKNGRTITIHPEEGLLIQLRQDLKTETGRSALRERTTIEHSLARLSRIQGNRARYKGTRKNSFDLRRCSAVDNLQTIARTRLAA
jgi:hypothetical protein